MTLLACMTGCDKCTADGLNTECDICAVGETNRFARTDAGVCTAIVKDSADAYIYSDSTDVNDFCNNGIATKGSFIEMKGADTEYTCKSGGGRLIFMIILTFIMSLANSCLTISSLCWRPMPSLQWYRLQRVLWRVYP